MPEVVRQLHKRRLGRYRLIATLGQGGMGTIHLGVAEGMGGFRKLFVIKELKQELTLNQQFLEMFMREARLAARLNHPNVVHTIEADQEDGRYYLAMDFLDGQPFNEVLWHATRDPVPPLSLRLQVLCQALAGLHHAHELRDYDERALHVVHRDVSPSNIFVGYDGQVKVLDFGIAKAADMDEGTRPGEFKGKLSYAAPEQLRGLPADRRVDVFGAGVVLWEALAMRRLVQGKPSGRVFEARLLGTEPRIRQLLPELDPALAAICDRAMHTDPAQRYPTAEAFRLALLRYLNEREGGVDLALIARFMQAKFASARAELHRVIDAELHVETDDPATGLISLPLLESPARAIALRAPVAARGHAREQRIEARASAREQHQAEVRTNYLPANLARLHRKRRAWGRVFGVLAVASVGAAIAVRLGGEQPGPAGEARTQRADSEARAPAAVEAMPPLPRAPDAREAPPREALPSPPSAAAPADPISPLPGAAEAAAARSAQTEAAFDASTEAPAHLPPAEPGLGSTSPAVGPRRGGQPTRAAISAPARGASGPADQPSAHAREESKSLRAATRDAAAAAPPLSIDLQRLPRRQQRELDLENPFRK